MRLLWPNAARARGRGGVTSGLRLEITAGSIDRIVVELLPRVVDELEARLRAQPIVPAPDYLNVVEAAELLRSGRQRVYDLVSSGRLTGLKDGSRLLLRRAEIEAYLAGERTGRVGHRLSTPARNGSGSGVAK